MVPISLKSRYFIAVLVVFFVVLFALTQKPKSCARLECLSMTGLDEFRLEEVYQDDNNIYRALLFRKNDLLRVEVRSNIPKHEAEQHIRAQITRMKALFENTVSPYPGEISDEIVCGTEFTPTFTVDELTGVEISYFTGYLNRRLVFGACTEDQAIYRGTLALFYCPNQEQLFQLEIIAPNEDFFASSETYEQMLWSIHCEGS